MSNNSDNNSILEISSGILIGQNESSTKAAESIFTAYSPHNTVSTATDDDHRPSAISIGKRFIANLIPSSAFQPLKIPFPEEEHYLLSTESKYYINDKNLSSIVAFTLSSKDYMEFQSLSSNKFNMSKDFAAQQDANNSAQNGKLMIDIDECEQANSSNISNDNISHFEHRKH